MTLNSTISLLLLSTVAHEGRLIENTTELRPQLVRKKFLIEVIKEVHRIYNIETFVYYITERLDKRAYHRFFQDFWTKLSIVPNIIVSDSNSREYTMDGFLNANSLCIVFVTNADDPILDLAAKSLAFVRDFKTIFVLLPVLESMNIFNKLENLKYFHSIIEEMYKSIWKRQFLNTLILTIHDNVYIDDPYPTPTIINRTVDWSAKGIFRKGISNWKGYVVDIPVGFDMPRVFPLLDRNRNKTKNWISGSSGLLIKEFMAKMNANIIDSSKIGLSEDAFDFNYILNKIRAKTIEISIHTATFMSATTIGSSYPIGINDWCIIVPNEKHSTDNIYLQRTFKDSTWLLIVCTCFYISIAIWLLTPRQSRDYSASFLQAIGSVLYLAPTLVLLRTTKSMRCLFIILILFGFIISNLFVSKLASFLSTSLQSKQINTIEDIIATKLMIMVMDYEYEHLDKLPGFTPKFLDYIMIVDKYTMDIHRNVLNTSYGYSVTSDRWKFLNMQQRNLRKPVCRLSQVCMGPFYHAYPMQRDSHFYSWLKYFIMFAAQQGLRNFWDEQTFADALRLKYVHILKVDEEFVALSMSYFSSIWLVWWFGLMLSGLAFIMEMKWPQLLQLGRCFSNFWKWVLRDL